MKQVRGGLIDLEFICQFLQLAHAADVPAVLDQNTSLAFGKILRAGLVNQKLGDQLINAAELMHNLTQVMRIAVEGRFDPAEVGESLKSLLCRAGGTSNFAELKRRLRDTQANVFEAYKTVVEAAG